MEPRPIDEYHQVIKSLHDNKRVIIIGMGQRFGKTALIMKLAKPSVEQEDEETGTGGVRE